MLVFLNNSSLVNDFRCRSAVFACMQTSSAWSGILHINIIIKGITQMPLSSTLCLHHALSIVGSNLVITISHGLDSSLFCLSSGINFPLKSGQQSYSSKARTCLFKRYFEETRTPAPLMTQDWMISSSSTCLQVLTKPESKKQKALCNTCL